MPIASGSATPSALRNPMPASIFDASTCSTPRQNVSHLLTGTLSPAAPPLTGAAALDFTSDPFGTLGALFSAVLALASGRGLLSAGNCALGENGAAPSS